MAKDMTGSDEPKHFVFVPLLDLIEAGKYKFVEDNYNVSPFSEGG